MKQPVVLCYNLDDQRASAIRLAAMRLKIRMRPVALEEYALTLSALCGLEPAGGQVYEGEGFADEMLVMANFPAGMMNAFLQTMRSMRIAPVALKAMLTPTNSTWDSMKLHEEIQAEHAAMNNGEARVHQD